MWLIIIDHLDRLFVKLPFNFKSGTILRKMYQVKTFYKLRYMNLSKLNNTVNEVKSGNFACRNLVILVAGPYVDHLDFTLINLKRFRMLFPETKIYYSTDSSLSEKTTKEIEKQKIDLIQNTKFDGDSIYSMGNLLAQINNMSKGLSAITDKKSYVLRVRSDQIVLEDNFVDRLFNYSDTYNANDERILKISMNSFINRDFSTSDMFMFGHYEQMKKFWDINYETYKLAITNLEINKLSVFPESILDSLYFKEVYAYFPVNRSDYLMMISECYLIVDEVNVGILWYKEHFFTDVIKSQSNKLLEINHSDWLRLRFGLNKN